MLLNQKEREIEQVVMGKSPRADRPETEDAKILRKRLALAEAATRAARTKEHQLEEVRTPASSKACHVLVSCVLSMSPPVGYIYRLLICSTRLLSTSLPLFSTLPPSLPPSLTLFCLPLSPYAECAVYGGRAKCPEG